MTIKYSRIFVALDGSDTQDLVSRKAVRMAADHGAELLFGHVVDAVPTEASGIDFRALCQAAENRIREDLADVFQEAQDNPAIPSMELKVSIGSIQETIDELIEPFNPELIICGERGLSKIRYVFVGSVSTHLIRSADCDVLVVKQH